MYVQMWHERILFKSEAASYEEHKAWKNNSTRVAWPRVCIWLRLLIHPLLQVRLREMRNLIIMWYLRDCDSFLWPEELLFYNIFFAYLRPLLAGGGPGDAPSKSFSTRLADSKQRKVKVAPATRDVGLQVETIQ